MEAAGLKTYLISMIKKENKLKQKSYRHFDASQLPTGNLLDQLNDSEFIKSHSFWPFLHFQIKVSKYSKEGKKDKMRELYYSSHIDSYIYQLYNQKISLAYEKFLTNKNISFYPIAYRNLNKSNIHFANETFNFIKKNPNSLVLCFDIEKFFDILDHSILKINIQKVLNVSSIPIDTYLVLKSLLKYSWVERDQALSALGVTSKSIVNLKRLCNSKDFRKKIRNNKLIYKNINDFGIPQGSALSALLSNIYMIEFDLQMAKFAMKENGYYRRYSDDIILIIPCPDQPIDSYNHFVKNQIEKLKLKISDKKTEIIRLKDGISLSGKAIQYLGFIFLDGEIRLRPKMITNYYRKLYNRISIIKKVQKLKKNNKAFLKKFYSNYTHLGKKNFISYVQRAEKIFSDSSLGKDTKYHWNKIYKKFK
jgi:RNA-directed DNA polymerase